MLYRFLYNVLINPKKEKKNKKQKVLYNLGKVRYTHTYIPCTETQNMKNLFTKVIS